ncbi:MAG TPA: competence/damage-inducible protein A [Virgibacillus sp.]|nr:competence/damage-inducible protein A [Virgibacillus sp.]
MTKQLKAEIIAVGTELLLGQIANTNAQWLSQQLSLYGINVYSHAVVGDNLKRVEETFSQAHHRSDIIIVTGGLGPTEDDMTREAFQLVSNLKIQEDGPAMEKINAYFEKQGTVMTENNRRQARVFEGAEVLANTAGMAPGMIVTHQDKLWIFLPGVPREMKQITTDKVLPYLKKMIGKEMIIKSKVLKSIGIGESRLEYELSDMIHTQTNPTIAPLAQNDGVVIRLTAKESSEEKVNDLLQQTEAQIREKIGDYLYGTNDETIEHKVVSMLKAQNKRIAAAESLTGGMFTAKLVAVEGASQVCSGGIVCYDTKVKQDVLGVSANTIQSKGTVSEACALEMAAKVRDRLGANIGISFTGVAGLESIEGQPSGTVYIAICTDEEQKVEKFSFQGDRNSNRKRATLKGFELLFNYMK